MHFGGQLTSDNIFYFNHFRLFELAKNIGVDLPAIQGYRDALTAGVCDSLGFILKKVPASGYMYSDCDRMSLYNYVSEVYKIVFQETTIYNISDLFDRNQIKYIFVTNDLIFVQGQFTFKPKNPNLKGVQLYQGIRSANKVSVNFVFDLGEATSVSAWSNWLRGQKDVGCLIQIKEITRSDGKLVIEGTVLAILNAKYGLKNRTYEKKLYTAGILPRGTDESDLSDACDEQNDEG